MSSDARDNHVRASKMKVPFCRPSIGQEEIDEVTDTLRSGWLTMGPKTKKFERALEKYLGAEAVVAVNSCTAALHLSLVASGIKGEVITSPYTFVSPVNTIIQAGAKPVFADIDEETFNIDPERVKEKITDETSAIIPVHFAGQPCDMDVLMDIAEHHDLIIIEDAAHAIGAEYKGKKIGSFGDLTCFSFYATKNMTTGEGGAITTSSRYIADKLELLRLHGMDRDAWKRYDLDRKWYYDVHSCGYKYNMTDIQAALGIHQLEKLDSFIRRRREIAHHYTEELKGVVQTPIEKRDHTYHLYPILVENRDKLITKLAKDGISCSVHFVPVHLFSWYKRTFGYRTGDFPNAESVYNKEVSLPIYPRMTDKQVDFVISKVRELSD